MGLPLRTVDPPSGLVIVTTGAEFGTVTVMVMDAVALRPPASVIFAVMV